MISKKLKKKFIYPEHWHKHKDYFPLIDALNCIPGLKVDQFGIPNKKAGNMFIWFKAKKVSNLNVLSRATSIRYGSPMNWICELSDTEKKTSFVLHSSNPDNDDLKDIQQIADNIHNILNRDDLRDYFDLEGTDYVNDDKFYEIMLELDLPVITQYRRDAKIRSIISI